MLFHLEDIVAIVKHDIDIYTETKHKRLKQRITTWEKNLKKNLSVDLPAKYLYKKRPYRSKLFPYRVSKHLVDNIKVDLKESPTTLKLFVSFNSMNAYYTNNGVTRRGEHTSDGALVGWINDVLYGKKRKNITPIATIIKEVLR